jgi:mRNA interferase RelE/StbE
VSYGVIWSLSAVDRAAGFLLDDAPGLSEVMDRVDDLEHDPCPQDSTEFGSLFLRRWQIGRYRVVYEIDDDTKTITIVHLGRLG